MRLASESEDREMNVLDSIKPHTYEAKLKKWVNETTENHKKFMATKFSTQENYKVLVEFHKNVYHDETENFDKFKEKLNKQSNGYIKKLFENSKTMNDVEETFESVLGKEYLKLKGIEGEWVAFLSNATNKTKKLQSKLNNGSEEIDFLTAMIMDMSIIGATCIHIASSKYAKMKFQFDYVIMDESSKASPAETLVPINMGRNIILIGDHKQLPPVVTREDAVKQKVKDELEDNGLDIEKEFGESLFEKLITAFEMDEDKQKYIKMLNIQYRMPKQIGELISKFFYDGKLNNPSLGVVSDIQENEKHGHGLKLKIDTSIIFLSTSKREKPNDNGNKFRRENECNMKYIKEILEKLNVLYADNLQKEKPFTIGIIAGYRGQVELLRRKINIGQYNNFVQIGKDGNKNYLIEINTVDKFQGAERDIIIYDIVRSDNGSSNIGFLDDDRRINVAFSRVKRLLIVAGDSEYIIEKAQPNPGDGGEFKKFKLKEIARYLKKEGLVFNNLEEVF
jgi:superfamily I DNA and/or RNA helicase